MSGNVRKDLQKIDKANRKSMVAFARRGQERQKKRAEELARLDTVTMGLRSRGSR